jgi:hypothetical protein
MLSPLGNGVELSWERLLAKYSGIRSLKIEDLKLNGSQQPENAAVDLLSQMPSRVVGAVPHGSSAGEFDSQQWIQGKV